MRIPKSSLLNTWSTGSADLFLIQCHDPCALVEILSWDSKCDSIPERETVDALHFAIKKVKSLQQQQMFEVGDKADDNLTVKWIPFRKKLEDIVCSRCLPLLSKLCYTEEQNNGALSRNAGLMRALCDLISCCAELCGNDLTEKLAAVAVPVLLSSGDNESLEATSHFDVDTAIEVIACAVPFLRPEQIHVVDKVQSAAVTCIKTGKDAVVSKVVVKLLFSLLNNNHLKKSSVIRIWESLNAWQAVDNSPGATTRILLCLTALSDYLLPSADTDATETIDLRVSEGFWELVQKGLTHRDNVSRKRALYLLKRSVAVSEEMKSAFQSCQSTDNAVSLFWWSPERNRLIVDFWEDYMLIMETLDETQQMVTLEDVANFIQHFKTDESLSRGTLLWTQLCDWLHVNDSVFKPMEGVSVSQPGRPAVSVYVQHLVEAYMKVPAGEGNSCFMPDWFEAELVAKMVLLASDVEEIQGLESETHKPKQKGLEQLLYPLLDALRRLSTNVYLPVLKTDKSLQLLFKLLHISYTTSSPKSHDTVLTTLQDCILSTTDEVLEYILRRLTSELCLLSDLGRCCLYISVLRELVKLYSVVGWRRGSRFWSFIKSLTKNSLLNLQANRTEQDPQLVTQIQKVVSMSSLAWVCEVASHNTDLQIVSTDAVKALINYISSAKLNQTLMKPAACEESQGPQDGATLQGWGRVAAQCVHDQWACLHFVLNKFAKLLPSSSDIQANGDLQNSMPAVSCPSMTLQCAVEALAILPSDQVLPVLSCMKILVPKIWRSDASLCVESMNLAWKVVKDLNSNPQDFWTTLEAFIQFVFDANLLRITVEDGCLITTKVKETFVVGILDKVYQAGFCNNQASVKYLIEWFLMLTLYCYPEQLHTFWDCFRYDQEKSKTSICTFLSVLTHFDILLENVIDKRTHLKKALDVILLWCFNHNFAVRLYALLALKKVWNVCRSACSEDVEFKVLAPVIEACLQQVEYMQGSGNAMKNWQRIQEHFFFGTFHPLKDYSIESIFYTFPSLSDLADDEWIPLWKFSELVEFPTNSSVSLNNPRKELGDLETGDWVQQDKGECENDAQWIDVQKKIIPWKNSIPDQDLELLYQERAARLGKFSNALIVVASLIDKPTNLGGLCRTCEIFGASALVVSGLHYINDKQFQSLSVSSEHWLPLVEVKPPQLINYLQQKTAEGYTIVGVEQTAKSQSLTEYTFPEKTLLLLGNEREGIPANLLQHLAVCVEIPQHGVTRSLNVHVSGALLIWEYTHQQMNRRRKTM
ncbi:putative methyltransferase TARBP1 [Acipenser ruthenus]|uniref:tRNA (guanosine(18)-2'-O)-methyltransferase TARBP1 n=1 Tax=Acipenser ruthenus TaxID=7906 RepID=A0A444UIG8_ACIRT|nr:putative methyltransferase TARBP1 [Acipenser ruthenus]